MTDLPDVLAAVVLGPEDKLVLRFDELTPAQSDVLNIEIARAGFGGRVLCLVAQDVYVLRAPAAAEPAKPEPPEIVLHINQPPRSWLR